MNIEKYPMAWYKTRTSNFMKRAVANEADVASVNSSKRNTAICLLVVSLIFMINSFVVYIVIL